MITTPYSAGTVESDIAAKPNSLTAYWYRMSNGNLWLYGDEHAYEGPAINTSSDFTSKANWHANNQAILQWYADNYDLRSLDNNSDGVVDMIMLICRARAKYPYGSGSGQHYGGVADGDYLTNLSAGTITISDASDPSEPDIVGSSSLIDNSGVYGTDCYNLEGTHQLITHELGHQLWNSGHRNGLHRWNLMSGAGSTPPTGSGEVASAFEKFLLGWLAFTTITTDQVGFELNAMTSSNQAIRIPVGATSDYFVLEYRQNITHYEIIDPSTCPDTGVDEGLRVSYMRAGSSGPDIRPADNNVAFVGSFVGSPPIYKDGDASDLFPNGGITKITPYTTPNTADRNGNRTGLAILNIQYSGAGNEKVKFDIRQNYWEGPITTNTTWSGQVYVGENITVNSGVTLTISAGTTVLFAAGKKLIINGSIQGNGASGNPITFDRSGASGTWAGLWIENSSAASNLNYCALRNSTYGLRIKNSNGMVTIDHATLTDNSFGLLAENSSPFTIQNSTMQDNAYGVYVASSSGSGSMKILSNNISSNSTHGVYLYNNADAFLGFNTITGNTQHGIYCYSNSDATIRSILPSLDYGGNIIHSNGGDGVRTAGTSYPSLGVDFQQGGIKDYYGYNEIQGNDGDEVGNSNASGTIMAERN